jgi:hypothetical protein
MKKLSKLEKKVFAYLNRHVPSVANKQAAIKMLNQKRYYICILYGIILKNMI